MVKKRSESKVKAFVSISIVFAVLAVGIYAFSFYGIKDITSMTTADCVAEGQDVGVDAITEREKSCCADLNKVAPIDPNSPLAKKCIRCGGTCNSQIYLCQQACGTTTICIQKDQVVTLDTNGAEISCCGDLKKVALLASPTTKKCIDCTSCDASTYSCSQGCSATPIVTKKRDYVGVYRPSDGKFHLLKGFKSDGTPDEVTVALTDPDIIPGMKWIYPVTGDWNNDGTDEVGFWKESDTPMLGWKYPKLTGGLYLRYTNTDGQPDIKYMACAGTFTAPGIGDWDGDGMDTYACLKSVFNGNNHLIGIVNGQGGILTSYKSSLGSSVGSEDDVMLGGDFDGDKKDVVVFYNPRTKKFTYTNGQNGIAGTLQFNSGMIGDIPLIGDWDGDGIDTIGIYRPSDGKFYLAKSNQNPDSDPYIITYGKGGDIPIKGKFFVSEDLCMHSCGNSVCDSSGGFEQGMTCPETKFNCPQDCWKKCSNPLGYEGQIKCENGNLQKCVNGAWKQKTRDAANTGKKIRNCGYFAWEEHACVQKHIYGPYDRAYNGYVCAVKGSSSKSSASSQQQSISENNAEI